ncbi:hypothetical protein DFS34DRAFT_670255 [Phlyctochytrium arcticum]|nr:hypothetical protein DFS34DRAFT_670255 [Phlyctochytrium arcticum]
MGSLFSDHNLLGIVEKCGSLEELDLSGCHKITPKGIVKILPFLKNVRKLDVRALPINDNCLYDIAKMCPLLEDLDLWGTRVTRTGVSSMMKGATKLTPLNLSQSRIISSSDMEAIKKDKPPHLTITTLGRRL